MYRPVEDNRPLVVLEALSVRAELVELVIEQARAAGASWAEVDDAARLVGGEVKTEYERVLGGQRRFGLVDPDRAIPGRRSREMSEMLDLEVMVSHDLV